MTKPQPDYFEKYADTAFSVDVDLSTGVLLTMQDAFPNGWPHDRRPTANDLIEAMKEDGNESRWRVVNEWDLANEEDCRISVEATHSETDKNGRERVERTWAEWSGRE